jgi:hypothetical protein
LRFKIKGLAAGLVLVAGCLTVGVAPAGVAAAQTTTALPISSFDQIVADPGNGYLFLSSPNDDEILVTSLAGQQVATIADQFDVRGMALSADGSTLYAALGTEDAVSAISTTTLEQTTSYALPTGDVPLDVAVQSGKVWVSYSAGLGGPGAIGDFDLTAVTPAFETQAAMGSWNSPPALAADPQDSGILVAAELGTPAVASYDTSADPVSVLAQDDTIADCTGVSDMAVVSGGTQVILDCGTVGAYSTADLAFQDSYASDQASELVAVDSAGDVAADSASSSEMPGPDLYVYQQNGSLANTYNLTNAAYSVFPIGLAWNPDGSQLFVVLAGGSSFSLQVIETPTITQTTLTLTGPSTAQINQAVTLTGRLTFSYARFPPAGTPITITRSEAGSSTTQDFSVTTAADGSFSLTDTPPAAGQYTYAASYSGSSTVAAATASQAVTVSLTPATLTLTGPSTAGLGQPVTLTGSLTIGSQAPPAGTAITITRSEAGSTTAQGFSVTTAADGSFSLTDTPPGAGQYTYTATYSGSSTVAAATASQAVTVTGMPASLTLTASPHAATYEPTVRVTAHLGTTDTNRTVSIYATTLGSFSRRLVKTGTVNASGNLAFSERLPHSTTFTAVFSGDADYAPATARQTVYVRAKTSESLSGYYLTKRTRGKTYHLFHRTKVMRVHVAVAPNKAGECVEFALQVYSRGAWRGEVSACAGLSSSSKLTLQLSFAKSAVGHRFRIRADYIAGIDASNRPSDSAWQYFMVEK